MPSPQCASTRPLLIALPSRTHKQTGRSVSFGHPLNGPEKKFDLVPEGVSVGVAGRRGWWCSKVTPTFGCCELNLAGDWFLVFENGRTRNWRSLCLTKICNTAHISLFWEQSMSLPLPAGFGSGEAGGYCVILAVANTGPDRRVGCGWLGSTSPSVSKDMQSRQKKLQHQSHQCFFHVWERLLLLLLSASSAPGCARSLSRYDMIINNQPRKDDTPWYTTVQHKTSEHEGRGLF